VLGLFLGDSLLLLNFLLLRLFFQALLLLTLCNAFLLGLRLGEEFFLKLGLAGFLLCLAA
jgi:hypothetical protein